MVEPLPKSQKRLVMVPLELSATLTVKGAEPLVGLATKSATGTSAPMPAIVLVLLSPLAVVKTTTLLKLPVAAGLKLSTRLLEPKPGRSNAVPETNVKGPPSIDAWPLVIAPAPALVTTKLACAVCPASTSR